MVESGEIPNAVYQPRIRYVFHVLTVLSRYKAFYSLRLEHINAVSFYIDVNSF